MTNIKQEKKKWGWRKLTMFNSILVAILLFVMFGGRGAPIENMEQYAENYLVQIGVVDDIDGVVSSSTVAIAGTQSRVVVMHLEDGRSTGVAFTKVPIINRWKLTDMSFPGAKGDTVYIRVNATVESLFIKTDGKGYTVEDKMLWDGTYGNLLSTAAFSLVLFVIFGFVKRLWVWRKTRGGARIDG